MSNLLTEFNNAKSAIAAEFAAFTGPLAPEKPDLTNEQHAIYRRGGFDGLVSAGHSDAARAKVEYLIAHEAYRQAKNAAAEALRLAKAAVGYDEKQGALQAAQAAVLAKDEASRTDDEKTFEAAAHEALGALSMRGSR